MCSTRVAHVVTDTKNMRWCAVWGKVASAQANKSNRVCAQKKNRTQLAFHAAYPIFVHIPGGCSSAAGVFVHIYWIVRGADTKEAGWKTTTRATQHNTAHKKNVLRVCASVLLIGQERASGTEGRVYG